MRWVALWIVAVLGAVLPTTLCAAPVPGAAKIPEASRAAESSSRTELPPVETLPASTTAPLVRLAAVLVGMGALSSGLAYWSRRRRQALPGGDASIRILAHKSLSPRHQVVLIDVSGHRLLVGTAPDSISSLADWGGDFAPALERELPRRETPELVDAIGPFEGLDD